MKIWANEVGQAVSEYALILALVAAVSVTVLLALQDNVTTVMTAVSDGVTKAAAT